MSFSRLNHDSCTYKQNLKQSVGVGNYYTGQPRQDCQACFPEDTHSKIGSHNIGPIQHGISGATCEPLIDVSNELLGLSRPATNCPSEKYQKPEDKQKTCRLHLPPSCKTMRSEDTRLSNPPCTLRGTGWNRWEWLCQNPQEKVNIPFDYNISNRLVVKDNHRPCIPTPINQAPLLPPLNGSDEVYESSWMSCVSRPNADKHFPSVVWRHCDSFGYK